MTVNDQQRIVWSDSWWPNIFMVIIAFFLRPISVPPFYLNDVLLINMFSLWISLKYCSLNVNQLIKSKSFCLDINQQTTSLLIICSSNYRLNEPDMYINWTRFQQITFNVNIYHKKMQTYSLQWLYYTLIHW